MWTRFGQAGLICLALPLLGNAQEADRLAGGPAENTICAPATSSNEPVPGLRVTRSYGAPSGDAAYRAGSLCAALPVPAAEPREPAARAEARATVRIVTVRDRRRGTSPYALGAPRP